MNDKSAHSRRVNHDKPSSKPLSMRPGAKGKGGAGNKKNSRKLDGHEVTLVGFKRNKTRLQVNALEGGQQSCYVGIVTDFDRFSLTLQIGNGTDDYVVLFKHAIQGFHPEGAKVR